MCSNSLGFWLCIHFKAERWIGTPILLGLSVITTTVSIPALPAQRVAATQDAIAQLSNPQTLLQQGIKLYDAKKFAEAITVFSRAGAIYVNQADRLNQALVLRYLSLAYQHLGQWQEAERAIAQSLNLLENQKRLADNQAYLEVFAKALNTQGRLLFSKGQFSEALEAWRKAAATYKKADNETGIIGSSLNQAEALQALGLSSQAEAELLQVEQILLQQKDLNLRAIGLQNLGKALRRVGNLSKSQEVLQKSWAVAREPQLSRAMGSALLELGNTERALAERSMVIGNLEAEKKHREAAIALYQQAANSPNVRLQAQLNLLSLMVETGKSTEAVKLGATIQQAIASLPPSQTTIYAQLNFARSLMNLEGRGGSGSPLGMEGRGEQGRALPAIYHHHLPSSSSSIAQILATAIQQARSLQDRRAESYALGQLGGLYEMTKQWSAAQNLTQQALLLAEEIQALEIRYQWEWQLGRLLEKQGDTKEALVAYKEAFATLKSVRRDLLAIDADVQFSFRDNVEPIHRQLVDLLLKTTQGSSQPSQENLQQAIGVIDSLRLAELENFLNCSLSPIVQIDQNINKVDEKAAFIYPIILEDRLEVIFQLPGQSLKHYVTPVKRTDVEENAIALRGNILRRNRPEAVIEKATRLYKWLILPLEQDLKQQNEVKTLVFMLDGVLRNIPISVLYDSKRQEYLMQKQYALALVPGLQLFDLRPLQRERLKILAAGMSEKEEVEGRSFDELPNVLQELQQIASVVPSELLLNPKFTKASLQQQINSGAFSAVHIATHGKFSSDPEETFILAYNQLLKSNDLNNLLRNNNQSPEQSVELLVLSACETAQGDNRATLGLAGIAVRAGARSTLATLWQVSDRSTAEVMGQFYKELTNPEVTKAEALHQAQLALFKQYKAPYYWAPYVLVGNWL
jgi:CHAT domain-containing protein